MWNVSEDCLGHDLDPYILCAERTGDARRGVLAWRQVAADGIVG